jgi:hypothetical protein
MRRVDERQGDEGSAVLGPGGDRRQLVEPDVGRDALDHRAFVDTPRPDFDQLEADVARAPQLAGRRRQQSLRKMDDPLDQPQRPLAEGELRPRRAAEQVGDQPEFRALDVGEEQGGTAGGDHAAMDLRDLEIRIDRRVHRDDRTVTTERVEKGAEIREAQFASALASAEGP